MDEVIQLLKQNNFAMKKKFGQNFITDTNLLAAIADDARITNSDVVVEIGAGAGTLTAELCRKAKKVVAFEIDESLGCILQSTLCGFNNVSVIFKDVMRTSREEIIELTDGRFKVVANLPYYITSPVLFYFLENDFPLDSLTVMVQKEVALRMVAKCNTPDYGALSLAVQSRATAVITRSVSRTLFYPSPNVDSAVVRLDMGEEIPHRAAFDRLVKCAFACRRKTLVNNLMLSLGFSRDRAEQLLCSCGLDTKVRGEALSKEQFLSLAAAFGEEK